MIKQSFQAVIIGVSSGGFEALPILLGKLPEHLPLSIIVICHRLQTPDTYLTEYLNSKCTMEVREAEHLEPIIAEKIYLAPAGYHLLISDEYCFNLSADPPVNASRPSIDLSFETAAEVFQNHLIGVVLTGANHDGAAGLKTIKEYHGYTIVQDPTTAKSPVMPSAALAATQIDFIGSLEDIAQHICNLSGLENNYGNRNTRNTRSQDFTGR